MFLEYSKCSKNVCMIIIFFGGLPFFLNELQGCFVNLGTLSFLFSPFKTPGFYLFFPDHKVTGDNDTKILTLQQQIV